MSNSLAWIAGKICRPEEAKVSVYDRGFLFGDGVYETGRSYRRTFLFLEEHLERLRRSAGKLQIAVPWTDAQITSGLAAVAKAFNKESLYFRTILTRGELSHIGLDEIQTPTPTLVHLVQDIDETALAKKREQGIQVMTSRIVRNSREAQDPNIKTSNYLNSLLALQDVKSRGAQDAILCNSQGEVTEGTTFSIFGVLADRTLITPSLEVGILDSITRRHVITIAHNEIAVKEGHFSLSEFQACKEAFIASSVREIVPIQKWDEVNFAPIPGPVTARLQEKFKLNISEYLKKHDTNF